MIAKKSFLIVSTHYLSDILGFVGLVILSKLWGGFSPEALGIIGFAMSTISLFNIFTNPIDFAINREAHEISNISFYEIGNSIFTDGISIDLLIKDSFSPSYSLSSDDIFEYYNFNSDSIDQYFNNNSNFDITKIEIVCDNIYYFSKE